MSNDIYQRWFFDSAYVISGRPKMEDLLMQYARRHYYECLVYESFLPKIVKELKEYQETILEQNKRLKKAEIYLSKDDGSSTRWLNIGEQNLVLRKVRDEIDYQ